jgi:hypothetical protein
LINDEHPIWETLRLDEHNIGESKKLLESHGLMVLFEEVCRLFNSLPREIEADLRDSDRDAFARTDDSGKIVPARDFILRTLMLQSAGMQYLHAVGHLLRGHCFEMFGHARTMIENAGVAYLSKAEPDLGDLYFDSSDITYRNRTPSSKLLPKGDPLTSELKNSFDHASEIFHSNFISVAGRMKTNFTVERGIREFRNEMQFHDVRGDRPEMFLGHAAWLLRVGARVLRLFASAFSLSDCVWYRRFETFERDRDRCFSDLSSLVDPAKIAK